MPDHAASDSSRRASCVIQGEEERGGGVGFINLSSAPTPSVFIHPRDAYIHKDGHASSHAPAPTCGSTGTAGGSWFVTGGLLQLLLLLLLLVLVACPGPNACLVGLVPKRRRREGPVGFGVGIWNGASRVRSKSALGMQIDRAPRPKRGRRVQACMVDAMSTGQSIRTRHAPRANVIAEDNLAERRLRSPTPQDAKGHTHTPSPRHPDRSDGPVPIPNPFTGRAAGRRGSCVADGL